MKQSKKLLAVGIAVGCLTIGGSGIIAMAGGNAYQNFKTAAMQTLQTSNLTMETTLNIIRNDEVIASETLFRQKKDNLFYSLREAEYNGNTITYESMMSDSEAIYGTDGIYTRIEFDYSDNNYNAEDSPNTQKLMGMLADILVGDVKNNFTGDQNHVSLSLNGSQVPELLNVAVQAMYEQSMQMKTINDGTIQQVDSLDDVLSQMTNLQIKTLTVDTDIEAGILDNTNMSITLTYQNSQGEAEEISFHMTSDISNVGSTTPESIDLTNKEVHELTE